MPAVVEAAEFSPILQCSRFDPHFFYEAAFFRGLAWGVGDLDFFAETLMHVHAGRKVREEVAVGCGCNHRFALLPSEFLQVERDDFGCVAV